MKKLIAILLATVLLIGCTACGAEPAPETTAAPTTPVYTQPEKEASVLKVLTLGHSLAVDAGHMLAMIAHAEGYSGLKVGTLYYSGCPLNKHVQFLKGDAREYSLYISSTDLPNNVPEILNDVTMGEALRYDYWDIIVMQGGVFEIGDSSAYTSGNIEIIQQYVNEQKLYPGAIFGWNMAWAPPVDNDLRDTYTAGSNGYYTNYEKYNHDRTALYNSITKCVGDHIVTNDTFQFVIPSATVMENALSSYLTEKDIHRDFVHASDLARVMVSYVWFCTLTGVDHLDEIKLDAIPRNFFRSLQQLDDYRFSETEKALILECVNNALANPLQMTQSQFTEAPAAQ